MLFFSPCNCFQYVPFYYSRYTKFLQCSGMTCVQVFHTSSIFCHPLWTWGHMEGDFVVQLDSLCCHHLGKVLISPSDCFPCCWLSATIALSSLSNQCPQSEDWCVVPFSSFLGWIDLIDLSGLANQYLQQEHLNGD